MDLLQVLEASHDEIARRWIDALMADTSSRYSTEDRTVLEPLMQRSARAFRLALCGDDWDELDAFINMIAHKRLEEGFKLSDVQGVFHLYAQTLIPLLVAKVDPEDLASVLLNLNRCVTWTVARFSEYFQDLHNRFIRDHARLLEQEVAERTRALAESERKYKTLVEDIQEGYFVAVDGAVAFANGAFCAMHGYPPEEVLGRSYLDFVAPESRADVRALCEQSQDGGAAPDRVEYLRLHRDGRRIPTELLAKASAWDGAAANLGVCRDFSERVELERKKREAESLNAVAQVAASLAHDIRNPLTAIKMNLQILAEGTGVNATLQRLSETSLREVASIERSVTEMLDLARPFRLHRETVAVEPLLSRCLETLALRMRAKNVTAVLRPSPEVPVLRVDAHRMEQALVNLLFNAVEALPEGGSIRLETCKLREGDRAWAEVCVADDGPGIPRELLPYLFDDQKCRGIGLGLSNVRKIVEAHGGTIDVTSREPSGLTFRLRLPLDT